MRKTFDESQVLFRYPSDNPIPRYVVVKDDSASSKIRVYSLSVGSYCEASTGEYKAVIVILLSNLAAVQAERDVYQDVIEKTVRGCPHCLWSRCYVHPHFPAALAQGQKLREGE